MKPNSSGCLIPLILMVLLGLASVRRVYTPADVELGLKYLEDVERFNAVFLDHFEEIRGMGLFWGNESWKSSAIVYDRYVVPMGFDLHIRMFGFGSFRLKKDSIVGASISEARMHSTLGMFLDYKKALEFESFPEDIRLDELLKMADMEPIMDQPVDGIHEHVEG